MAYTRKDNRRINALIAINFNTNDSVIFNKQISYFGTESNFTTPFDNAFTHSFHHGAQLICTYVRFMFIQDFFWSAKLYKIFGDFMQSWMCNAGCQFTIREGTCTTLAKLYIGFGLKYALLPKRFYILATSINVLTSFKNDWTVPFTS